MIISAREIDSSMFSYVLSNNMPSPNLRELESTLNSREFNINRKNINYINNINNIGNNIGHDIVIDKVIQRSGDIFNIKCIKIKNAFNENGDIQTTFLKKIELIIGGNRISILDILFIDKIFNMSKRINNDLFIDISMCDIFFNINICLLCYHNVLFKFTVYNTSHNVNEPEIDIIYNYSMLITEDTQDIIRRPFNQRIKNFLSADFNINTSSDNTNEMISLSTRYHINGIFLTGIPINVLSSIKIYNDRFRMINRNINNIIPIIEFIDNSYIHYFCNIINDDTLYIPLCGNNMFDNIDSNSFNSTYDNMLLLDIITSTGINYDVKVGIIINQSFSYIDGIGGLQVDYGSNAWFLSSLSSLSSMTSNNTIQNNNSKIKWKNEIKPILDSDYKYCCVTLEYINIDEKYITCNCCNKNFKENVIKWIEEKFNCPHCRNKWDISNYILYENIGESVL